MKKKILLALPLAALLATFTFVGCGDSGTSGDTLANCHHQAFCFKRTDQTNKICDAGKNAAEISEAKQNHDARVQQAKDAGVFQEEFEECCDM